MPAVLAIFLLGVCGCSAAVTVRLDEATAVLPLAPFLSLYRDASGAMTVDGAREVSARGLFSPGTQRRPSLGFTKDAVWVRFAARNHGPAAALWFVELRTPRMDTVDAYLVRSSGEVEHFVAGNLRPPPPRGEEALHPVFPLSLKAGETGEFFLRVHSETSVQLPLGIVAARSVAAARAGTGVFPAGLFGYLSALIVLGVVFGVASRERGCVIYSLSLVGIFACYLILSGYWSWLGLPGRAFMVKQGVILTGEFAAFMMVAFQRRVLDLGVVMPRVDRWAVRVMWAGAAATPVLLVIPYRSGYPLFVAHLLLLGVALMVVGFRAWRRGVRVARFYSLAWVVFWLCLGVSSIHFLARQPMSHLPWMYGLLGMVVSATLFLVAIADRVREIRRSAMKAQARLLEAERKVSEELRLQMRREQLLVRDLHDGVGGLTANLAVLAEVGRRDASEAQDRERFARISVLASDGGAEVRSLMSSLEVREMSWPDFFDECRRYGQMALPPHGIAFTLAETGYTEQPGPGVFPGLSLLRVIKEALTNTVKHSGCTRVGVLAEFAPHQVRLTVRDNGRGLPAGPANGRGLRNMAARIHELNGTMGCRNHDGLELVFEISLPVTLVDSPPEVPA